MFNSRKVFILLFSVTFTFPPVHAQADEVPWKIQLTTGNKSIEQLSFTKFEYKIILNNDFLQEVADLKTKQINSQAILTLIPNTPTKSRSEISQVTDAIHYWCSNNISENFISNNSPGSNIRGISSTISPNEVNFSCTFPQGMRTGNYQLTISIDNPVSNSNRYSSRRFVYLFGDSNLAETPSWLYEEINNGVKRSIPGVKVLTDEVFATTFVEGKGSDHTNQPIILNKTELFKIIKELQIKKTEYSQNYENSLKTIDAARSRCLELIDALNIASRHKLNKTQAQKVKSLMSSLKEINMSISKYEAAIENSETGNLSLDFRKRFLENIDFDVTYKPEILNAYYPNLNEIDNESTIFVKIIVRSKSVITAVRQVVGAEGYPGFNGNVLLPGSKPSIPFGESLILVEEQVWDGYFYTSSILISARGANWKHDKNKKYAMYEKTYLVVTDAANNQSNQVNPYSSTVKPVPASSQEGIARDLFDETWTLYGQLHKANLDLQNERNISIDTLNELSGIIEVNKRLDKVALSLYQYLKINKAGTVCENNGNYKLLSSPKSKCPNTYRDILRGTST